MSTQINAFEIVHAIVTLRLKNKKLHIASGVIIGRDANELNLDLKLSNADDKIILSRCGLKDDAVIIKIEILKRLGVKNRDSKYTIIEASETNNKRNSAGGYD